MATGPTPDSTNRLSAGLSGSLNKAEVEQHPVSYNVTISALANVTRILPIKRIPQEKQHPAIAGCQLEKN